MLWLCAGAGLTYGASLNNLSEAEQLQLTLYRCADALAAYTASREIVAEYASGKATISQIDLDGAKSSLAYNIISGTANKPAAVTSQWAAGYTCVQADYTPWLLSQVDKVSAADALHALKVHLTPLFDSAAVLVATAPSGKASELAISLGEAHAGEPLRVIPEEALPKLGGGGAQLAADQFERPEKLLPPSAAAGSAPPAGGTGGPPTGGGRGKSAFAFALSKQFKCECPKCDPAFQVKIAFPAQGVPMS